MVIGSDELQDLSEEMYSEHRIAASLYCGNCGYNLRRLPYVYTCPECGSHYDANALRMQGIFLPDAGWSPWADLFSIVLCLLSAVILIGSAVEIVPAQGTAAQRVQVVDLARFYLGLFFAALAPFHGWRVVRRFRRFLKRIAILRRIRDEEE
jgi:hypothetical protein